MDARLTGREKQVLKLIHQGLTNKEIAVQLNLSTYTIENHCKKIFRKLQVKDRFEAADFISENRVP